MLRSLAGLFAVAALAGCASPAEPPAPAAPRAPTSETEALAQAMGVQLPDFPEGAALDAMIRAAARHPLGSAENPVRVRGVLGQHGYLRRLRCSSGAAPRFSRVGPMGGMPFGRIVDGYRVECPNAEPAETIVHLDLYHPNHREQAAPPGFTLAPE